MATVKHPTLKNVSYEVDDDAVDRWRAQGWKAPGVPRKDKPKTTDKK